jgi:hypothetical protein
MDKDELLILAASNIASGIAEKAYQNERGSVAQRAASDHIATLSVSIALRIMEEVGKQPKS